ncbi:MAG: hypothetical protein Q7R79_01835 [bacterium]|nr:hypothetical protein [bacterium]
MTELLQTKEALVQLYEKYKRKGVLSIYIWGSILTEDFNSQTSDIDAIAIVDDSFSYELKKDMKTEVLNTYPNLVSFSINIVYASELNGGPIKAGVASVIYPKLLLLDLPNWFHVAGRQFTQKDFQVSVPTYDEAISVELLRIKNDHWETVEDIPEDKRKYFIKKLARIVDLIQKQRGNKEVFSYSKIVKESQNATTPLEQMIARAVVANRNSSWDSDVFRQSTPLFQEFIDALL